MDRHEAPQIRKEKTFGVSVKGVIIVILIVISGFLYIENKNQEKRINVLVGWLDIQDKKIKELNTDLYFKPINNINPVMNSPQSKMEENNSSSDPNTKIKNDCQESQARYNTCLTEYNTKMLEYQSCLSCKERGGFGCEISCTEPYNNCNQYKPLWC